MKKLDGAGTAKLETLDRALKQLARIHSLVEKLAIDARSTRSTAPLRQSIQRAARPLVGLLKGQFGMIADTVASLLLVLTRGGGEDARVRALREHVAHTRTALEIAVAKVHEKHTIGNVAPSSPGG